MNEEKIELKPIKSSGWNIVSGIANISAAFVERELIDFLHLLSETSLPLGTLDVEFVFTRKR